MSRKLPASGGRYTQTKPAAKPVKKSGTKPVAVTAPKPTPKKDA